MITIIDYGLGNISAFANVYKRLNVDCRVAKTAEELRDATRIILPGVGAFDHAMALLNQSGMRSSLEDLVLTRGVPVMGVCVGMQILAESSDEGTAPGLGWIKGRVRAFREKPESSLLPQPHMGWNDVHPRPGFPLFADLQIDPKFYFLHSFYFECDHAEDMTSTASYGFSFASSVSHGNIHGVQFHPEKSHQFGTRLLKNFTDL